MIGIISNHLHNNIYQQNIRTFYLDEAWRFADFVVILFERFSTISLKKSFSEGFQIRHFDIMNRGKWYPVNACLVNNSLKQVLI